MCARDNIMNTSPPMVHETSDLSENKAVAGVVKANGLLTSEELPSMTKTIIPNEDMSPVVNRSNQESLQLLTTYIIRSENNINGGNGDDEL